MMSTINVQDAARYLCRSYPGGIEAMAQRLGKSGVTLRQELSPPAGCTAKLGADTLVEMMHVARGVMGDALALAPLDALELEFGRMAMRLPLAGEGADEGTVQHVAQMAKEFADVMGEVSRSAADGRITDNELAGVKKQCLEMIGAMQGMLMHLAQMNAQAKPAHLRAVNA